MTPDDERHGTYAGTIAHYLSKAPTCDPCKEAGAEYRRKRRARLYLARTTSLEVDRIGSIRRIQALVRVGHPMCLVDERMGWAHGTASRYIVAPYATTHRTTANKLAAIYDDLCMIVPAGPYAKRSRLLAIRKGWESPLAWDDDNIDDPDARPHVGRDTNRRKTELDPVIVDRLLAGQQVEHSTRAERDEAMRRWTGAGRSAKSLADIHGWKAERYGRGDMREAS